MINLNIIRSLCDQKKITLKDLAEKADLSENGLQEIMRRNSTKTETLERIAKILSVPVTIFFLDEYSEMDKSSNQINEPDYKDLYIKTLQRYNELLEKNMNDKKDTGPTG